MTDDATELAFGFEHPGGGPAKAHVAGLPALDVAADAADRVDHRLARVRGRERALEPTADSESSDRQRLLHALAQGGGGARVRAGELVGEPTELIERAVVVVERPRLPKPAAHERTVTLGQVVQHVSLLVPDAALDRR